MNEYQFTYKGITYECCGDDKELQIMNFKYCILTGDWDTIKNRIKNQLRWFPDELIVINTVTNRTTKGDVEIDKNRKTEGTFTPTITPSRTESIDSDIQINQNGKQRKKFW